MSDPELDKLIDKFTEEFRKRLHTLFERRLKHAMKDVVQGKRVEKKPAKVEKPNSEKATKKVSRDKRRISDRESYSSRDSS